MKKNRFDFLVLLLLALSMPGRADVTAESLVNQLDEVRGYKDQGFAFNITNVSYKKDKEPRTNTLSVKVYNDKSLIHFESPAREKGRAMLKEDSNMWLYIPGTRRVIRIAPSQRLIGETSNGDVVGTNFSSDYSAKIVGEEALEGQEYWMLALTSVTSGVAYAKVKVWMAKAEGHQPLKSEFYSRSGRLLKTAFYKEYKRYDGKLKLHKLLLVDALMQDNYTWMKFDGYRLEQLDQAIFQKASLGKLN
ncbi:outer membrane lipoprotein-sorting protein [Microbulbifer echini]|uniref:Outer membrane lipoprotein-sorting protein n=1 Tax=Microbulbifer echini TaxID=1529067 RepID=A0ABV4NMN6_9GAMM|nr:outer membrane lipoprotein-sorting protein [uncultured Microbulbifer sp.]